MSHNCNCNHESDYYVNCYGCDSPVNNFFPISIDELRTLYKILEHHYISYEDLEAHRVVNKIMKIINE